MTERAEDIIDDLALAAANFMATQSIAARRALREHIDRYHKYRSDRNLVAAASRADQARAEQPGYRRDLDG